MLQNKVEKIASAILFSTPGVNSSVKLNSLNAMYHLMMMGLEASMIKKYVSMIFSSFRQFIMQERR